MSIARQVPEENRPQPASAMPVQFFLDSPLILCKLSHYRPPRLANRVGGNLKANQTTAGAELPHALQKLRKKPAVVLQVAFRDDCFQGDAGLRVD